MPYILVQITAGSTREEKARLVKEFTDCLVRILRKRPEHTHIVIHEVEEENWGFQGLLTDEWRAAQVAQAGNGTSAAPEVALINSGCAAPLSSGPVRSPSSSRLAVCGRLRARLEVCRFMNFPRKNEDMVFF